MAYTFFRTSTYDKDAITATVDEMKERLAWLKINGIKVDDSEYEALNKLYKDIESYTGCTEYQEPSGISYKGHTDNRLFKHPEHMEEGEQQVKNNELVLSTILRASRALKDKVEALDLNFNDKMKVAFEEVRVIKNIKLPELPPYISLGEDKENAVEKQQEFNLAFQSAIEKEFGSRIKLLEKLKTDFSHQPTYDLMSPSRGREEYLERRNEFFKLHAEISGGINAIKQAYLNTLSKQEVESRALPVSQQNASMCAVLENFLRDPVGNTKAMSQPDKISDKKDFASALYSVATGLGGQRATMQSHESTQTSMLAAHDTHKKTAQSTVEKAPSPEPKTSEPNRETPTKTPKLS